MSTRKYRFISWGIAGFIPGLFPYQTSSADHLTFNDVLPIFQEHCLACHRNPGAPNGLSMESFEELISGSQHGDVVIKGDPENSELIKRLKGESMPRMPFNGPPFLTSEEIDLIQRWIHSGLQNNN